MERRTRLALLLAVFLGDALIGLVWGNPGHGPLSILFYPFRALGMVLIEMFVVVLLDTATIYPNPPVEAIHRLTFVVALLGAVVIATAAGLSLITGQVGLPYPAARQILPRLIVGLGVAVIALPVLQVFVELADALVQAFRPRDLIQVQQLAGLTTGLVLVWVINALALLALVLLFVVRNLYLVFIAAVLPLLTVGWAFPNTRPYARSFLSSWFALLAVAPADALVLRFSLTMLQGTGAVGLQPVSNWILGTASFALMLWIPFQLLAVSQGLVGGRGLAPRLGGFRRSGSPGGGAGDAGVGGDRALRWRADRRRDRDRRW